MSHMQEWSHAMTILKTVEIRENWKVVRDNFHKLKRFAAQLNVKLCSIGQPNYDITIGVQIYLRGLGLIIHIRFFGIQFLRLGLWWKRYNYTRLSYPLVHDVDTNGKANFCYVRITCTRKMFNPELLKAAQERVRSFSVKNI